MMSKNRDLQERGPREDPERESVAGFEAPEAPDGGYAWVIVVVAFLIHVIVDGAAFGYGVISNHIKEYYDTTESQATLVGSLQLGFYLLSCPVSGKLVERFGFKFVCLTGSLLATVGFSLSQLAPNIAILMITYGVIAGTGFGMMYLSCISAVTLYFDRRRVLATGLATMGSGLGMFAFSAICNLLISLYDWKNALLILGGITLQGCVLGMLLRPLEQSTSGGRKSRARYSRSGGGRAQSEEIRRRDDESGDASSAGSERLTADADRNRKSEESVAGHLTNRLRRDVADDYINSINSFHNLASSLQRIERKHPDHVMDGEPEATSRSKARRRCVRCASALVDLRLLSEPIFYIICVANIFAFLGAFVPLKFQVDRAMTFDLSPNEARTREMASFLVSVSGIASTVGRGSSAILGVRRNTNKVLFHNIAVLGAGVACFFNVFSTTYPLMIVFAVVFTFFFGIYIALSSVVVCELLGPEAVNNAFALMCMLRGFANIAGGPIAGAAYDVLQDYDVCFYIGGAMMTTGAVFFFLLLLPTIQKRSFRRQAEELDIDVDVNSMIASLMNVNATTDQDKKLSSCLSISSAVGSKARLDNVGSSV